MEVLKNLQKGAAGKSEKTNENMRKNEKANGISKR
jgi:hypothetical protein